MIYYAGSNQPLLMLCRIEFFTKQWIKNWHKRLFILCNYTHTLYDCDKLMEREQDKWIKKIMNESLCCYRSTTSISAQCKSVACQYHIIISQYARHTPDMHISTPCILLSTNCKIVDYTIRTHTMLIAHADIHCNFFSPVTVLLHPFPWHRN